MTPPTEPPQPHSPLRRAAASIAAKLSRVTASREFIPEVDGLRFIALMPVLFLHSATHFLIWRGRTGFDGDWTHGHGIILRAIGVGSIGVQLFFVISGFIVALPFARHHLADGPRPLLGRYFMRRFTRIEPPYVIALIAIYLLWQNYRGYLPDLLAGLVYLHKVIFGTWNPINAATWTLEIEVMFYALAPWLTQVYRIPRSAARWTLQLLAIAAYSYLVSQSIIGHGPPRLRGTLIEQLPYFFAGILVADLYACGLLHRARQIAWDAVALATIAAILYCCTTAPQLFWTVPLLLMAAFAAALEGRLLNALLRLRPITLIGGMCYTAYLWHTAMLVVLRAAVARWVPHALPDGEAALIFCLLMVPVILLLTAPIYYFIEKPFMNGPGSRWIERRLRAVYASVFGSG
jgi:peptidoglycan/LPS O-acetylase OafA/YrhL